MEISQLGNKTMEELAELAKEMGITNHTTLTKQDLSRIAVTTERAARLAESKLHSLSTISVPWSQHGERRR